MHKSCGGLWPVTVVCLHDVGIRLTGRRISDILARIALRLPDPQKPRRFPLPDPCLGTDSVPSVPRLPRIQALGAIHLATPAFIAPVSREPGLVRLAAKDCICCMFILIPTIWQISRSMIFNPIFRRPFHQMTKTMSSLPDHMSHEGGIDMSPLPNHISNEGGIDQETSVYSDKSALSKRRKSNSRSFKSLACLSCRSRKLKVRFLTMIA